MGAANAAWAMPTNIHVKHHKARRFASTHFMLRGHSPRYLKMNYQMRLAITGSMVSGSLIARHCGKMRGAQRAWVRRCAGRVLR